MQILSIYIDSNVLIEQGNPIDTPLIERLIALQNNGIIKIVTTDLTIMEIAKKFAQNDHNLIKDIARPAFQKVIAKISDIEIEFNSKAEVFQALLDQYRTEIRELHDKLGAKILSIDTIQPSIVFDAYAYKKGVFDETAKKDQFPDAFIVELIKGETTDYNPITIITSDADFDGEVNTTDNLNKLSSLEALITQVDSAQLDDDTVQEWLDENTENLCETFQDELNEWSLQASDVMDGEVEESKVSEVHVTEFSAFNAISKDGHGLIIGKAEVKGIASVSHPNWDEAMYDSEDKVLIPFESVSSDVEFSFSITFAMSVNMNEDTIGEVSDIHFVNESEFLYFEFYPYNPYQ